MSPVLKQVGRQRRGATLVLVAVSLIPLLAVLGIAIDVGNAYKQRRAAQIAADAGAVSAVWEIYRSRPDLRDSSGRYEASRNGFTNGVAGDSVQVDSIDARRARVTVTTKPSTMFAGLFGITTFRVQARATAAVAGASSKCVYLTAPSGADALLLRTGAGLTGASCNVYVNSNSAGAVNIDKSTLKADSVVTRGTITGTVDGNTQENAPSQANPLSYLSMPTVPSGCNYLNKTVTGTETLVPGATYCGGIDIKGSSARATMPAGTYFMVGGGFTVETAGKATGNGITIVNTFNGTYAYDPIMIRTGGIINLSAPTSGPLNGILFFEDPSAPTGKGSMFQTGSGSTITGSFYFPNNSVTFQTGGDLLIDGGILARTMKIETNTKVTFTGFPNGSNSRKVSLVD
jgi:Flp pilus assembly protein TadG